MGWKIAALDRLNPFLLFSFFMLVVYTAAGSFLKKSAAATRISMMLNR